MGSGHPGRALLAQIGQFLLFAQVLLTAQAHPFRNNSMVYGFEDDPLSPLVERASASEFSPLPRNTKMLMHDSCEKKMNLDNWQTILNALTAVAQHGQQTAAVTAQIIDYGISIGGAPPMADDHRRMMDLFTTLYGTFDWNDASAVKVGSARAHRLSEIATILSNGLTDDTMRWRWVCNPSEWVLSPTDSKAWMIKDMDLSPRADKVTDNICIMPATQDSPERDAAAFVLDAPKDVANVQHDWITFCDDAWNILLYQMHQYQDETSQTKLLSEGSFIESVIFHTWERLLAHELFHGKAAFGSYAGVDTEYGWVGSVKLAIKDNGETDVNEHRPLKNNDSFTYWLNGFGFFFGFNI
ncbi:hypothetical protein N7478_011823 [Penicillium angulare]|uniref:uncharacterized protein n=1 Tax=Penicillium angulare TaxID=116970 RepID=UPI002541C8CE|nr:uncharacterized protein N7478_011823 [Penicillium angulare]KAJ5261228.1 hypothetical protein N7478_011823 [Penicillium angulare]